MNTNSAALKLCPFCGSPPYYGGFPEIRIECQQCKQAIVKASWYGGDLGTMEASWNKRLPEDQSYRWLVETLEIIEGGLRLYRSTPGVLQLRA